MRNYMITKEESVRINILKFIAIVFVVYIHSYAIEGNIPSDVVDFKVPYWLKLIEDGISEVIARCGVPIFFLISAILLFMKDRDYLRTIKDKVRSLLIPYFVWNTFWIIVFVILENLSFTKGYFPGTRVPILERTIEDWLYLYGIGTEYPIDYPLWFIRDLMVVMLCFPFIQKMTRRFSKCMLVIGVGLIFVPFAIPFKAALAWFIIGCSIVELDFHFTVVDKIPMYIATIVYTICVCFTLFFDNEYINGVFVFCKCFILVQSNIGYIHP